MGVEDDSKVLGMRGGINAVTREDKGVGWDLGALLGGADEEEFGFRGIEG